jgi:hypothetical protein
MFVESLLTRPASTQPPVEIRRAVSGLVVLSSTLLVEVTGWLAAIHS